MPIYISKQGLEELESEFLERTRVTRREIAELISSAKDLGDLSENFEYQDAKEQQALNEARIAQLEAMIHDVILVEETSGNDMIGLGCRFTAHVNGAEKIFVMVGSTEADPIAGKISNESPLGVALMGRRTGEVIAVTVPSGVIEYKIVQIN